MFIKLTQKEVAACIVEHLRTRMAVEAYRIDPAVDRAGVATTGTKVTLWSFDEIEVILGSTEASEMRQQGVTNYAELASLGYGALADALGMLKAEDVTAELELHGFLVERTTPTCISTEVMMKRVDELGLSVRAANGLQNFGIYDPHDGEVKYVYQLVSLTEVELMRRAHNFGRKSLIEVKEVLGELGLALGMGISEKYFRSREIVGDSLP